jgi:hypothetical protein
MRIVTPSFGQTKEMFGAERTDRESAVSATILRQYT